MRRLFSRLGVKTWAALLVVALTAAAGLWLNRDALVQWYTLRGLDAAADDDRAEWAQRAADLDGDPVPALLDRFTRDDARVCANAEAALSLLAKRWGPQEQHTAELVRQLAERFTHMSTPGQEAALELQLVLLVPEADAVIVEAAGKLLAEAAKVAAPGVRLRTLALAEVLAGLAPGQWVELQRELVRHGLEADAPCKVRALHLALHSTLRKERELQQQAAGLLRDSSADVRRAALLVVGMAADAVPEDDLLPLLHDEDGEVRRLCQNALRGRGLGTVHLKLAWLLTHRDAAMRLEVLGQLGEAEDLDAGVWLRRLTHDADAAVRVAAVRAAAEHSQIDLSDRLREMQQNDPSATVRGLARYWLTRRQRGSM